MQTTDSASPLPIITIVGSLNVDLTTFTSRVPSAGETLSANSFQVNSGGKGANQAVACAKLSRSKDALHAGSATVKMVGAVGDDLFGHTMLSDLKGYGVNIEGVQVKQDTKTGVAVILVEEKTGDNRILLSAEANHTLLPENFLELPMPLPSLLIMQLEIPFQTVMQILKTARKQGIEVLLNPAPAIPIPEEAYRDITHLVVNETEAAILSGRQEKDLDAETGLLAVAEKFQKLGAKNVLITLGGRGVFYLGSGGKSGLISANKANVIDTTAAGDTFVGSYALEVIKEGFDIAVAVKKANRAAALTVERKGAQVSIPWADELSSGKRFDDLGPS